MRRTQVSLDASDLELLDRVSRATGASRSELIRRAVRSAFAERTTEERIAAIERSVGVLEEPRLHGGGVRRRDPR